MRGQPLLPQPRLAHQANPNSPSTLPAGPGGDIVSWVPMHCHSPPQAAETW